MRRIYGYAAMIYPVESCEAGPQSGIQPGRGCSATQQMDFLRSHQFLFQEDLRPMRLCKYIDRTRQIRIQARHAKNAL